MAGLSPQGFELKRLPQIKDEIEAQIRAAFGEDVDLRSESVFGQLVGIQSLAFSEIWEMAQAVHLAFDPDYAEGVSLDSLAALTGVTRLNATKTEVDAVLYGNPDTVIPAGSEARNKETKDVYLLTRQVAVNLNNLVRAKVKIVSYSNSTLYRLTVNGTNYSYTSDGTATETEIRTGLAAALITCPQFVAMDPMGVITLSDDAFTLAVTSPLSVTSLGAPGEFEARETGERFVPAGSLEIQTTVPGWLAVENPLDAAPGRNIETDAELRLRRRMSVSFPATATVDAIRSRLLQLDDVKAARVYENDQQTTVGGLPPQHLWAIVQGGEDAEIAEIIYAQKAGGIGTYGDTTVQHTSISGQLHPIKFERPNVVLLYVKMTIKKTAGYNNLVPAEITAALVDWVSDNVSIGESLKYSRLFTPINSVTGFEVLDLKIGTSPNPTGEASIDVGVADLIVADSTRVTISVQV